MTMREEVGVPAGSEVLDIDGVRLAVAREGSGPPVVCLHAIGHGGRDFEALVPALRDRFEIVRVDWPGQGRSGPDTEPPTAARYATLLAAVLERLGVRSPILIGNSIGGAAALLYAHAHPVEAVVLCDPGGLVAVNAFVKGFCGLFARFFGAGARGARWFEPAFRIYYRFLVLPSAAAAPQRERILRSGREIAHLLAAAWRGFARPEADLREVAASLDVAVWFAWARGDRVIPLRLCMPCIRRMKNARVTTFRGRHAAFLEQPAAFTDAFLHFVADTAASKRVSRDLSPSAAAALSVSAALGTRG